MFYFDNIKNLFGSGNYVVKHSNSFFTAYFKQGVVPTTAVRTVKELFVPENRLEAAKAEAEALPCLEINTVKLSPLNKKLIKDFEKLY